MQESTPTDDAASPPGTGVLRRKMRRLPLAAGDDAGAARAWRLALSRVAEGSAALDLAVLRMTDRVASLPDVLELPDDHALILLLDGPGGQTGLAILSAPLLAGVVEAMTLGQVLRRAPDPRPPSRTDSVMAGGLLDAALREAEGLLDCDQDLTWISDFHQATYLVDPRPLGFMMEDVPYRVLTADIALAGGVRQGRLTLVLPAQGKGRAPNPAPPQVAALHHPDFSAALAQQVAAAEVRLDAIIARLSLPLGQLMALQPGDVLQLEGARLDHVAVTAIDGTVLGSGRLGQVRGNRAVRLMRVGGQAEPAMPPGIAAA